MGFYSIVKWKICIFGADKNRNISVIVNKQQKDKNLLKKLIYVVIGEMYELNKEYNDINFFLDEFPSEPECEYRKDFLSGGDLFFYKNTKYYYN